ncbi:MAG: hypothetical protein IE909_18275 [Campylobacterales bacterium]|nr:hypothetical protein [Campylobacterales bacterium]
MLFKIEFDNRIYPFNLVIESAKEWEPYVEFLKTTKNSQKVIVEFESIDMNVCHEFSNYVLDKISSKELN